MVRAAANVQEWKSTFDQSLSDTSETISVLIVDGFSNHNWSLNTEYLRAILEESGYFKIYVTTCPDRAINKLAWNQWDPNFEDYSVVIQTCNNIGKEDVFQWPDQVKVAFESYVSSGGGVYIYHGANNAFKNWKNYNKIIGLGWRDADFGQSVYIDDQERMHIFERGDGDKTGHGKRLDVLMTRMGNHPIHKGLPKTWMSADVEVYRYPRGTVDGLEVISFARDEMTGLNFPTEWVVTYGSGRAYASTYGHLWKDQIWPDGMRCAAFQECMIRALLWLSGNEFKRQVDADFPTSESISLKGPINFIGN